jgi:F0F1-type ATP synthase alpha subunit
MGMQIVKTLVTFCFEIFLRLPYCHKRHHNKVSKSTSTKTGVVLEFSDQVAIISGISDLFLGELLYITTSDGSSRGFVFNIEGSFCKVPMVYGDESKIAVGDRVFRTNRLVQTKCGFGVLGEIINPIGDTILSSKVRYFDVVIDSLFHTF